jgi:hypothetical protein
VNTALTAMLLCFATAYSGKRAFAMGQHLGRQRLVPVALDDGQDTVGPSLLEADSAR